MPIKTFAWRIYASLPSTVIALYFARAFAKGVHVGDVYKASICGLICVAATTFTLWYLFRKGEDV